MHGFQSSTSWAAMIYCGFEIGAHLSGNYQSTWNYQKVSSSFFFSSDLHSATNAFPIINTELIKNIYVKRRNYNEGISRGSFFLLVFGFAAPTSAVHAHGTTGDFWQLQVPLIGSPVYLRKDKRRASFFLQRRRGLFSGVLRRH